MAGWARFRERIGNLARNTPRFAQASEPSSATASSLLLGHSMSYASRGHSSGVRGVCCRRDVVAIRRGTKWIQTASRHFFACGEASSWSDPFTFTFFQPTPSIAAPEQLRFCAISGLTAHRRTARWPQRCMTTQFNQQAGV